MISSRVPRARHDGPRFLLDHYRDAAADRHNADQAVVAALALAHAGLAGAVLAVLLVLLFDNKI
ncbi:hypothetical protein ACWGTI_20390 [Mesorhizobium sp. ArgA1]